MRKDLRYGLGIGALLLAFVVTYLVVRNHTDKTGGANGDAEQSADASGGDGSSPAEANPAAPLASGDTAAPNVSSSLPPLTPAPPSSPRGGNVSRPPIVAPPSPTDDAFAPRPGQLGKGRGTLSANVKNSNQDWDRILSEPPGPGNAPLAHTTTPTQPPRSTPTQPLVRPREPSSPSRPTGGAVATRTGRPYTIQEGDTFVSIAKTAYGSSKYFLQIEKANPQVNPNRLTIGQQIILPELSAEARAAKPRSDYPAGHDRPINPQTEYRIDTNDSLYHISMKFYGTPRMMDAIYALNRDAIGPDPERLKLGMILKLPQAHASK